MKKFKLIACLLPTIFFLLCFNSTSAMPIPDYYYKYDFFPLQLGTTYNIYNLDNEVLIVARGSVGHVGTKELKSWTFQFDNTYYPNKKLKFYTRERRTNFTETKLSRDQNNKYTFNIDGEPTEFYLITMLDNPDSQIDLDKLPIITHQTNSDAKLIIHNNSEILNYDFRQHGGYFEYNFDEQVAYFKKILEGKSTPSDSDKIPSVISLNQPSWLGDSTSLVEGYNQTLQAFIDSKVGGSYLYSQTNNSQTNQKKSNQILSIGIVGIITIIITSFFAYLLIKKRKKKEFYS